MKKSSITAIFFISFIVLCFIVGGIYYLFSDFILYKERSDVRTDAIGEFVASRDYLHNKNGTVLNSVSMNMWEILAGFQEEGFDIGWKERACIAPNYPHDFYCRTTFRNDFLFDVTLRDYGTMEKTSPIYNVTFDFQIGECSEIVTINQIKPGEKISLNLCEGEDIPKEVTGFYSMRFVQNKTLYTYIGGIKEKRALEG